MKRFRVRFINEEAIVQDATKPADVSFDETQEQIENTEEEKQENALIANGGLQPQDVDNMTDGAVLGTMLSPNQEIQDDTLQALGKKATDFVNKVSTNTITPQEKKDIGNEVVANFKTAQKTGFAESLLWNDLETKILKSLNENNEYDFSDKGDFFDFCFSLGSDVADEMRADAQMSFDNTNDAVLGLVTDWIESHKDIVQKLWQKKASYDTDPSDYDIHVVKRHVLPLFLKKFGK